MQTDANQITCVLQITCVEQITDANQITYVSQITDANQIYDTLNLGRRVDVTWPDEDLRRRGGRNFWGHWVPGEGMEGAVLHRWVPHHPDPLHRSHSDKTIVLLQIDNYCVPVAEEGLRMLAE